MPIHPERARLVDDSRSFSADELTEVWEWLDSFDTQPLSWDGAQLSRSPLTFRQARYVFGQKTYRIARCSDGRELLGTLITAVAGKTSVVGYRLSVAGKTGMRPLESASAH
jgi:hypothetical protein